MSHALYESAARHVAYAACKITPALQRLDAAYTAAAQAGDESAKIAGAASVAAAVALAVEALDFDVCDPKGRRIGARIYTARAAALYLARGEATRDGKAYGSPQRVRTFSTPEKLATWRAGYLAVARYNATAAK